MPKPPPPPRPPSRFPAGIPLSSEPDYREVRKTNRPPAPPPVAGSLDEVERAIALLDDRHPDLVRVERETNLALAKKKAASDARARIDRAQQRRRWAIRGGVLVLVTVGATVAWLQYAGRAERARGVAASVGPVLAPYLSLGFTRVAASTFAQESVPLDVAEPTCFVAAASRSPGDGAVVVERPAGMLASDGTVAWCTCGAEVATVRVKNAGAGGVAVVRTGAADLGGHYGLFWLEPHPAVVAPPDECTHEALDAWIDKGSAVRATDAALDDETRGTLGRAGFAVAGSASSKLPFAIVPGVADSCALAWSSAPRDVLGLRLRGGDRPLADVTGPIGFCQSHAQSVTVWLKGSGDLVIERVAATRVGGTHGLHEVAPRLGLSGLTTWISEDDLAWDATATLRASDILPAEISVSTDGRPVKDSRIVALSIAGATVLADAAHPTGYACEPALMVPAAGAPATRSVVCVQSLPLPWRTVGLAGKAGIAEATLPFWMEALAAATDPPALAAELSVVKLGRRLVEDGFETTTLDGVTDVEGGALVTGRGGSDGVVAVQLSREAPWVSTCSNGDVWTVDGDPAVMSLAPGAQVKLTCTPKVAHDRRTIVFRHVPARPPR